MVIGIKRVCVFRVSTQRRAVSFPLSRVSLAAHRAFLLSIW